MACFSPVRSGVKLRTGEMSGGIACCAFSNCQIAAESVTKEMSPTSTIFPETCSRSADLTCRVVLENLSREARDVMMSSFRVLIASDWKGHESTWPMASLMRSSGGPSFLVKLSPSPRHQATLRFSETSADQQAIGLVMQETSRRILHVGCSVIQQPSVLQFQPNPIGRLARLRLLCYQRPTSGLHGVVTNSLELQLSGAHPFHCRGRTPSGIGSDTPWKISSP